MTLKIKTPEQIERKRMTKKFTRSVKKASMEKQLRAGKNRAWREWAVELYCPIRGDWRIEATYRSRAQARSFRNIYKRDFPTRRYRVKKWARWEAVLDLI